MLGKKQNSFDDFIAAAWWPIRESYTTPERLAAAGGSDGRLLMGAVLTHRPELFQRMLIQVPLLDMLRYHHFLIARLWIPEIWPSRRPGSVCARLPDYSPYHPCGTPVEAYPAGLLATANPGSIRWVPVSGKAELQTASSSERPVLLRLEARKRDTDGKTRWPKCSDELTDSWTFVFSELGGGGLARASSGSSR